MSTATPNVEAALQNWLSTDNEDAQAALALLQATEAAQAAQQDLPAELWRRYLDATGERRFLRALEGHPERLRWSETAFFAIRRGDYRLVHLLERNLQRCPDRTYLERSAGNATTRWSYAQVDREVRCIAATFFAATQHPRVALLSANDVTGTFCDLACLFFGILVTPINVHSDVDTMVWIFDQLGINVAVADTAERSQLLQKVAGKVAKPFRVVALHEESVPEDAIRLQWATSRMGIQQANQVLAQQRLRPLDEVATVLFTSGSTGQPKGVSFTEYHLVSKRFARHGALPHVGDEEKLFAYLPLYHTFGRYLELLGMLYWGGTYVFAGNPSTATLLTGLQQHQPTGLISIPLRWQQIHDRCMAKLDEAPDADPGAILREVAGPKLRWGLSAAGYLDPRTFRFFQQHGVSVCSGFGMTEATGGITMSPPGDYRDDTVGIPLPGVELRFGEHNELELRGEYVARYLDDAGPGDMVDPHDDYWLATGDIFETLGDGHVKIVDRIKDIYKNSKGQTIAPRRVEQKFTAVPGVERTFLVGDGQAHNVLLIVPKRDDPVLQGGDREQLNAYFGRLIATANQDLAPFERVVNFAVLERDFSAEKGELTPKGSYRRKAIQQNFAGTIEALYRSRYVDLTVGSLIVRIPRWLFRDLGVLETDVMVDGHTVFDQRSSRGLTVRRNAASGWVQLGDLEYQIEGNTLDLGMFCRQPWLWIGNGELAAFCNVKAGWDLPLRGVQRQVRLPYHQGGEEFDALTVSGVWRRIEAAGRLEDIDDPQLKEANRHVERAYFGNNDDALAAVDDLGAIIARSNERLAALLRRRLEALATHPEERVRSAAYRVLLLDEPLADYNEVFPAFIASGLTFLDETSIQQIARRNLQPRRLEALRQRLFSYRSTFKWPVSPEARAQFERIFQLLVDFVMHHPDYFAPVRAELAAWAPVDRDPTLAAIASEHLQTLVRWFDEQIPVDEAAEDPGQWKERLVFEDSVSARERARIIDALTDPTFFRKSMLLVHDVRGFALQQVPPQGIWVTQILTNARFRRYRLSINAGEHYELQLVLRNSPPATEELRSDFYAMSMAGYPFGSPVLPRFGYWRRDLRATAVGYAADLSVWEKIRQFAAKVETEGPQPWSRRWRKLFVRGLATLFVAWETSERRIVPGCLSPTNVLIPELDYRESASVLSLTEHSPYRRPRDLLSPILRNFYRRTVAHYPWCAQYLSHDWIFDAAISALGLDRGRAWIQQLVEDLHQQPLSQWPAGASVAESYLQAREKAPFIPLPIDNAIDRYVQWQDANKDAPLAAQEDILLQLGQAYRLERYAEWGRLYFYRHTIFMGADPVVLETFDKLLARMFAHPTLPATQLVELSDLQASLQDPESREVLSRMIFPEARRPHSLQVERVGDKEHPQVVVSSEIVDTAGARYTLRAPIDPIEIGQLHRLYHKERYPQVVQVTDQYFIAIDGNEQIVGGLCYQLREEAVAAVSSMVVAYPVQRRGIGGAILDDFCIRMEERGVRVVKAHLMLRNLASRQGFVHDPRWGGLVRAIGKEEVSQPRPPQLEP